MDNAQQLLDQQMLARLKAWPLRARTTVEGHAAGEHRSPYRGFSVEFAEHREYAPGDDPRRLDWKAFARTDKYYLKQYQDQTNLVCHLLVDASESMGYRSAGAPWTKLDHARRAAATLAWLVLHRQDGVGVAIFDAEIRALLKPSGNPARLNDVLQTLADAKPRGKTSIGATLHALAERLHRRGVVVLLSDLLDDAEEIVAGLRHLRHKRHETAVLHVIDPAEAEFPFERPTMFRGLEGMPDVPADPLAIRAAYLAEFARHQHRLQSGCRAAGADYVPLRTDHSLEAALAEFLASRS